jgi:hypothetical protein
MTAMISMMMCLQRALAIGHGWLKANCQNKTGASYPNDL